MSAFPDWKKYIVPQRRSLTGCIPTGYEIILRAAEIKGIDFTTFQDEFDLDQNYTSGTPLRNNFFSVAEEIKKKYPFVDIEIKIFKKGEGINKVKFIEKSISEQKPILISLTLEPFGCAGWHVMVVVDADDDNFLLLHSVSGEGCVNILKITKGELIRIHDEYRGGDDVAYLNVD